MAIRFGRATEDTWKNMKIREDVLDKEFKQFNGRVMFPSSHDIVDIPEVKEACFVVLEKLLEAENEVLITTKPCFNVIKDIVEDFKVFQNNMQFRFTITSNNDDRLLFCEPNAPSYDERLESLILAFKEGYKTSVSVEPFLDKDPVPLINELLPFITESLWIGPMNYIQRKNVPTEYEPEYERIRNNKNKENLKKIYNNLINLPKIQFKDSMLIKLGLHTHT
jgi:DNA repair photolyase